MNAFKKVALLCALLLIAASSFAQTAVSGTKVLDNNGALLASGQWCFGSTCLTVTNGAFSGSVTAGTQTVTVTNGSGTTYLTVPGIVVGSTAFNWDSYVVPMTSAISGMGQPRIACFPGATYTQTDAPSSVQNWTCTANPLGQAYWKNVHTALPLPSGSYAGVGAPTFYCTVPCSFQRTDYSNLYLLLGTSGQTGNTWVQITGNAPGGAPTSIQFNNSGALGGASVANVPTAGILKGQIAYGNYPIASPFTKHYAWGDSLTYGAYASSLFNAYPYWIAGHYNLKLPHDEGVSGATTNSANAIIFNAAPVEDGNTLNTYMLGTNDSRLSSGSTDLATDYLWALESELAYISLPNANKILGANFGTTGSWSAGNWPTIGIKSTTSGATATFTTVKGSTVLVDTTIPSAANAGTATLACDGTATGATLNFQYSGSTAPGTLGYNTALTIVSGLANTTHTCVVTVTSSSGTVELNWAAAIDPTNLVNYPVTFAADIIPQNQTPDYSSVYSPNVSTAVSALSAIGLNIHLVDTYSLFTPPTYYVDALHVTQYGYFEIANAFNAAIDTYLGLNPTYPNIAWQGSGVYNNAVSAGDLAIGYQSQNNTAETGANNLTIGNTTMPNATTAQQNTCIGNASCNALTTGGNNSAYGLSALAHATTTTNDTAIGEGALATDNSIGNNTGVGVGSCSQNATGVNNVCIGYNTGVYTAFLTQSSGMTLVGSQSSLLNADTTTAFTNSTGIGYSSLIGASQDTVVGAAAQASAANCVAIGFGANCSTANTAVIGNSQITELALGNGDIVVTKGTAPSPTITPVAENTTSASCASGWTCTNAQGLITVTIASTYTPGGIALITFGANAYPNTSPPNCLVVQQGGTVNLLPFAGGSGDSPPTYTAFYIQSNQTFATIGANTYNIAYWCSTQ